MEKTILEKAKNLRKTIESLAQNLSNNDALDNIELFPNWKPNQIYKQGYLIRFNNKLYRIVKQHYSKEEIPPDDINAGFYYYQLFYIEPNSPQPWLQPTKDNPYMMGDLIIYKEKTYKSLINNNMWNPEDFPLAWEEIQS